MITKVITDWMFASNKLERFWLLSKIEFKLRYYENFLGLLWALVKPLTDILIYYVAFHVIMKVSVPQFVSFLFLGVVLWNFFVESTLGTVQLLSTKKYLYEYTNMNKIEIYLSIIGSNLIGLFFNFCMFIIYYLFIETGSTYFTWQSIFILPIILNLAILSLAFSMILSCLYVTAKDISQIWTIVVNLGFWLSPIVYDPAVFSANLAGLEYINPISSIIINSRSIILNHTLPNWHLFGWGFVYALFFLLLGIYLLNTLGAKAAEKL